MTHRVLAVACTLIGSLGLAGSPAALFAQDTAKAEPAAAAAWSTVPIPETWKRPLSGERAPVDGFAWFRCAVTVPSEWKGQTIHLSVEAIDDARASYVNGVVVGTTGTFPPQFRSGLGEPGRFPVPEDVIRFGEPNVIAVRTHNNDGRNNFSVAAPCLYTSEQGIRMEGLWQYRPGDDADWASVGTSTIPGAATYKQVDQIDDLELYLKRRQGDHDPFPPAEALQKFVVADDLVLEQVLSEPEVRQPLFMNFDTRGRLWVLQYLQYPDPAGLKMMSRDQHLRTVYDKVPDPPPHHVPGRDRITIHEDTDGDGTYDHHKVFVDGLNIATSFAQGRGGVWVLNPPYLLFYPDLNQDDVPDSDPVVHLQGFGLEDSHSVVNSLRWGPDGWLYAAQGSTVTGNIVRPGMDKQPVRTMGQLIWRYHPESHRYEVFAEGGGNTFGVEIDSQGRVFSGTNGGNARGYHYVQGSYSRKSFGKHGALSNPYAYGYFPAMKHHDVPRFTHNFIIYEGGALPSDYAGALFGIEPLQGQIVESRIERNGSTFQTADRSRPIKTDDQWFRPVDIKLGPDGAIYIADFYEQRIDHSSHYAGRIHRESGRIYRLRGPDAPPSARFDYATLNGPELIAAQDHPNKWHRQAVLTVFADRRDRSLQPLLLERLRRTTGQIALESLWALNLSGGLAPGVARELLDHDEPQVRLWTVRLVCDQKQPVPDPFARRMAELAQQESYVDVRSQLACSIRRIEASQALPVLRALLSHEEDLSDPHMPLLLWWATESIASESPELAVELTASGESWQQPLFREHIAGRLMQRFASAGTRNDLLVCAELLRAAPDRAAAETLLAGFEAAFEGRSLTGIPEELVAVMAEIGGGSLVLQVRQGSADAIATALQRIGNSQTPTGERLELIELFSQVVDAQARDALLDLIGSDAANEIKVAALSALQAYEHDGIPSRVLDLYSDWPEPVRRQAELLLASRKAWARALVSAVRNGTIPATDVPITSVRKLLLHNDADLAEEVTAVWGQVGGQTTLQMQKRIAELNEIIASASGNPYDGRELFLKHCGKCHILFEEGGRIGPELTAYKRDDLQRMLLNVVNPSAEIREGFENILVITSSGRMANGFLADQDQHVVVLRGADGHNLVFQRSDIDEMQPLPQSVMPEGLLKDLTPQEVRDLFAYLRSSQPLP